MCDKIGKWIKEIKEQIRDVNCAKIYGGSFIEYIERQIGSDGNGILILFINLGIS